ncbi:uncharacterized protein LOC135946552 isoform X2 [Cloeon dipterum]|uniref:uncharacterized protein LOC135946552 isoform X2 n=1 Tax=Cloeon dipterum TaxID=197152 RepID=UPI00321FF497
MDVGGLMKKVLGVPTASASNSREQKQSEVDEFKEVLDRDFEGTMGNVESLPPHQMFQSPSKEEEMLALELAVQENEMELERAKAEISSLSSQLAIYEEVHKQDKELHKQDKRLHEANESLLEVKDQNIRDLEKQLSKITSAQKSKQGSEKRLLRSLVTLGEKLEQHGLLTIHYQKKLTGWKAGLMSEANDGQAALEDRNATIVISSNNNDEAEDAIEPGKEHEFPSREAIQGQGLAAPLPEGAECALLPEAREDGDMMEGEAGNNVEEEKDGSGEMVDPSEVAMEDANQSSTGKGNLYPETTRINDSNFVAENEAAAYIEEPVGLKPEQSSTEKDQEAVSAGAGLAQKKRQKKKKSRKPKTPESENQSCTQPARKESVSGDPVLSEDKEPVAQEVDLPEPKLDEAQESKVLEEKEDECLPKISRKRKRARGSKKKVPTDSLVATQICLPLKEDFMLIKSNNVKSRPLQFDVTPCDDDPQDAKSAPQDDLPDIPEKKMVMSPIGKPAKKRQLPIMSKVMAGQKWHIKDLN